jgi:hypothetical protein
MVHLVELASSVVSQCQLNWSESHRPNLVDQLEVRRVCFTARANMSARLDV